MYVPTQQLRTVFRLRVKMGNQGRFWHVFCAGELAVGRGMQSILKKVYQREKLGI
jgi:hypothetical protein